MKIYSRFDPPPKEGIDFPNPSLTEQCHKDDADIDRILKKYQQTGFLVDPFIKPTRTPQFGDFSDVGDFQTVQNRLIEIEDHFNSLPAKIRAIFGNDYANYINAMNDPSKTEYLASLGLIEAPTSNDLETGNTPLQGENNSPSGDDSTPLGAIVDD